MRKIVERSKEVIVLQEEKDAVEVPKLHKPAEITSLISDEIKLYGGEITPGGGMPQCW